MPKLYIGVDIGTSVTKGAVIDERGHLITQCSADRCRRVISSNVHEHDPDSIWWDEFCCVVRSILRALGGKSRHLETVAVTGMVPNICVLNVRGKPLHKALLYYDGRALSIERQLDHDLRTGPWQNEALSKIIWLRKKLSDEWAKASRILSTHNYIGWRLTDRFYADRITAMEYGNLFDADNSEWNRKILGRYQLSPSLFPELVDPSTIIGVVHKRASGLSGLPAGLPVAAGTSDTISTFLGAGVHSKGDLLIYYGTYTCAATLLEDIEAVLRTKLTSYPIRWVASIPRGGQQLCSIASSLFHSTRVGNSIARLEREALGSGPGANGVTFIQTARLPNVDNSTEPDGAIVNLRLSNTRADICRAVLEAFGYGLKWCFQSLGYCPIPSRCFAAGGGARSALWKQIVSDITGLDQRYFPHADRAYGSAVLSALSDRIDILPEIQRLQSATSHHVKPSESGTDLYARTFSKYGEFIARYNPPSRAG
jgi:xylulokinase